eukprot:scaffold10297_cov113-Isochrysis_galbana.AAC.12
MTTASHSSGARASRKKAFFCGLYSSSRWIVLAGNPTDSESTEAARAVGHASMTRFPCSRQLRTIWRTVNVLPVPGPPVSTSSRPSVPSLPWAAASAPMRVHRRTARRCRPDSLGERPPGGAGLSGPVTPPPHASSPAAPRAGSLRRTAVATASSSLTTACRYTYGASCGSRASAAQPS